MSKFIRNYFRNAEGKLEFGISGFGILAFGILVFGILEFGILAFGILEFGILGFGKLEFGILEFGIFEFGILGFGILEFGIREIGIRDIGIRDIGVRDIGHFGKMSYSGYWNSGKRLREKIYSGNWLSGNRTVTIYKYSNCRFILVIMLTNILNPYNPLPFHDYESYDSMRRPQVMNMQLNSWKSMERT